MSGDFQIKIVKRRDAALKANWPVIIAVVTCALVVAVGIAILGRDPQQSKIPEIPDQQPATDSDKFSTASITKSVETDNIALKIELCALLKEFLEFKDQPDFKFYGFGTGGPYNDWLRRVDGLREDLPPPPSAIRSVPTTLLLVAMEYREKGENQFVRDMLPELKATIGYTAESANAEEKP